MNSQHLTLQSVVVFTEPVLSCMNILIIHVTGHLNRICYFRFVQPAEVLKEVKQAIMFMTQFPDHFAGYDLVGQEDPGKPLLDYVNELQYPSRLNPPFKLPYFFHAGETGMLNIRFDP